MNPDLNRPCPHCGAAPGQRCTTRRGKPLTSGPHPARTAAASTAPGYGPRHRPGAWPAGTHPTNSLICRPDCPCAPRPP